MPIFDTHCHYNLPPLTQDWAAHWQKAQDFGVEKTLIAASNLENSQSAIAMAAQDKNLFASVGIHPSHALDIDLDQAVDQMRQLAGHPQVKAIGETGLDFYELLASQAQIDLFIATIKLAIEFDLPLIVHGRDREDTAYEQILEILAKHWPAKNPVIFHCVSGPKNYIEKALKINNSFFGFDGNLTFKNAEHLRDLFQLIQEKAPEKLLLETDSPFLAPTPHRGHICEPWMISETAKFAQENLQANLEQIYQNSLTAFNLTKDNL